MDLKQAIEYHLDLGLLFPTTRHCSGRSGSISALDGRYQYLGHPVNIPWTQGCEARGTCEFPSFYSIYPDAANDDLSD